MPAPPSRFPAGQAPNASLASDQPGEAPVRATSSRRRRLWELPHKFHCPLVGVCFECDELRALAGKVLRLPRETSDFVLHTTAVGQCEERSRLAELLHRTLERRHQLAVRQLAAIRTDADLRAAWRQACREGSRLPAVLWAVWTHPACDARLEQEIYGDIHMIQHQVGAGTRVSLKAMQALAAGKAEAERQRDALRQETEALRREKVQAQQALSARMIELHQALAAGQAREAVLRQELEKYRSLGPDLPARAVLASRLSQARAETAAAMQRLREREEEIAELRGRLHAAPGRAGGPDASPQAARSVDEAPLADPELQGKSVLCVGGRSGAVRFYRDVVEQSGGRFLHHDGGLEESLHRIDGALAAADIVICQAGCISHGAYWRVKDLCRRTGKPCLYVSNSSVSRFGQVLGEAARAATPAT